MAYWHGLKRMAAMAALAGLAACTPAERPQTLADAAMVAAAADPAAMAASVPATPALWLVRDEDTTIYLFGTIHVLKPGMDWFGGPVRESFDASDTLVLELANTESPETIGALMAMGMATDGISLRDRMGAQARARYEAQMRARGLDPAVFDQFEPWLAAMSLTIIFVTAEGYDTESGVEKGLETAASGKAFVALETAEEQLGFFDTLPMDAQLRFLDETVLQGADIKGGMEAMVGAWARGDADALAVLMNEGMSDPVVQKALLTDRNARWADWIAARMATPGTVFVAVGAGHLAGGESVQAMLAGRGMTVNRVQ